MRVIVQPLPMNPTLAINPTPMVVTTMATSTQMSVVRPNATTANPTPIPVTVYNLAQSQIQEMANPPMRRFQGEEDPSTPSGDNPPKVQQPKATATATAPQTREDTPWPNTMQPVLTCLSQGHHGQFPPSETSTPIFVKTEKAEDKTPPKIAAILHMMVSKPPQNKAEEMCRWGLHCPICAKSTPNPKAESLEDWNSERQDQLERNLSPKPSAFSII